MATSKSHALDTFATIIAALAGAKHICTPVFHHLRTCTTFVHSWTRMWTNASEVAHLWIISSQTQRYRSLCSVSILMSELKSIDTTARFCCASTRLSCCFSSGYFCLGGMCSKSDSYPYDAECPWVGQNCSINQWKSPAGDSIFQTTLGPFQANSYFLGSWKERIGHPTRRRWVAHIKSVDKKYLRLKIYCYTFVILVYTCNINTYGFKFTDTHLWL